MPDAGPSTRASASRQGNALVDAELRALYSALPVGVALLGPDLRYQRVNETLARLNGRSVSEHVGAPLEDVLGEHAVALREHLEHVKATREPLELELAMPWPAEPSDVRALEATFFPVADADDRLLGVGGVVRDITPRKRLEREQS